MNNTDSDLYNKRKEAAELSKGISSLSGKVLKIIESKNLSGDILDFGSGVGNFTEILFNTKNFRTVTGIDIMSHPENINRSIKWISQDLNNKVNAPDESYDVIVSTEVIEHLENPRAIFRDWYRLLRPGGILIFSTPNNESIRSLVALTLRGHFAAFNYDSYPAHITALFRKDCERICLETGFNLPEFYFSDKGGIPKFPTVKWQKVSFGMLKGVRFSDNYIGYTKKS